jgi:hypothetical protein
MMTWIYHIILLGTQNLHTILISLEILVTQLSAGMWLSAGDQCIWSHWGILSSTQEKLPQALLLGEVAKGWDWYGESTTGNVFCFTFDSSLQAGSLIELMLPVWDMTFILSSLCLGICKDFILVWKYWDSIIKQNMMIPSPWIPFYHS